MGSTTTTKKAYDLLDLRPIISGLRSQDIISQDEQEGLLNFLGKSEKMNEQVIDEAASLTEQKAAVIDALMATLRNDVGEQEAYLPTQPSSEPSPPADAVNDMLSK